MKDEDRIDFENGDVLTRLKTFLDYSIDWTVLLAVSYKAIEPLVAAGEFTGWLLAVGPAVLSLRITHIRYKI